MGSIPPPTSTPIWSPCRICQPDLAGQCSWLGYHHALDLVGALVDPGDHGSVLRASAQPEPAGSAVREAGPCDTGGVIRTAQVTGLLDPRLIGTVLRGT